MPLRRMGEWRYGSTTDLGTKCRWLVSFTPRPLYPRGKSPGTHWIGILVYPTVGLNVMELRNNSYPCTESTPAVQTAAHCYMNCAIPTPSLLLPNINNIVTRTSACHFCRPMRATTLIYILTYLYICLHKYLCKHFSTDMSYWKHCYDKTSHLYSTFCITQ
jgi:hypothetical protein